MEFDEFSDPLTLDRVRRELQDGGLDDLLCVGLDAVGASAGSIWALRESLRPELLSVVASGADPEDSVAADRVALVRQVLSEGRALDRRGEDGRFVLAVPISGAGVPRAVALLEHAGTALEKRPALHVWQRAVAAHLKLLVRVDRLESEGMAEALSFQQSVLRLAPIGLAVGRQRLGGDLEFRLWNDEMLGITGYDQNEVNRRGWSNVAFGADQDGLGRAFLSRLTDDTRIVQTQVELSARDGSDRFLQVSGCRVGSGRADWFLIAVFDRTEQSRLEGRVREKQHMESLGLLAGGIAHDFNNLLTGILGHTSLIESGCQESSELLESIGEIRRASEHAAGLCRQILAFSGHGGFVIEPVSWSELVEETLGLARSGGRRELHIDLDLADDAGVVLADRSQMQQILLNLAGNAFEALGEGGSLSIRAYRSALSEQDLAGWTLSLEAAPGPMSVLEVWNDGEAIPAEHCARIFDPFFSTKAKGRGLGLAAVFGIVKARDGAVDVVSSSERGTTIRIALPIAPPDSVQRVVQAARPEEDARARLADGAAGSADGRTDGPRG